MNSEIGTFPTVGDRLLLADARGNVTLAWTSGLNVYSSRYNPSQNAWTAPEQINLVPKALPSGFSAGLVGVVDFNGNVVVGWVQDTDRDKAITVARFDIATARWQPAERINEPASEDPRSGRVGRMANTLFLVVDPAANLTAVWNQELKPRTAAYGQGPESATFAARYTADRGTWASPTQLGDRAPLILLASSQQVAIDTEGNVTVAWFSQSIRSMGQTPKNVLVAVRHGARSRRWGEQMVLHECESAPCEPKLTPGADGTVLALWYGRGAWSSFYNKRSGRWTRAVEVRSPGNESLASQASLTTATDDGFTILYQTDDRPRDGYASAEEADRALSLPVSFRLTGVRYLAGENRWEEILPLRQKVLATETLSTFNARDLDPDVRAFVDDKGNVDVFWIQKGTVATDRSLAPITVHDSRYEVEPQAWRDGQLMALRPRGLYSFNYEPPAVVRDASGDMLFSWRGNFVTALPDNSDLDIQGRPAGQPGTRRSVGALVVAARYHTSTGTWSELAVVDEGAEADPSRPSPVKLLPLGTQGTLAVWSLDGEQGVVLRSRVLRSVF